MHSIVPEEGAQPSTAIGDYTITVGGRRNVRHRLQLLLDRNLCRRPKRWAQGVSGDITITMLDTEHIVFTAT